MSDMIKFFQEQVFPIQRKPMRLSMARYSLSHRTLILLVEWMSNSGKVKERHFIEMAGVEYMIMHPDCVDPTFVITSFEDSALKQQLKGSFDFSSSFVFQCESKEKNLFVVFSMLRVWDSMPSLSEYTFDD